MLHELCKQQDGLLVKAELEQVKVAEDSFLGTVKTHLLEKEKEKELYADTQSAAAFEAFINYGGNVIVYDECVKQATPFFQTEQKSLSVLDLGCGGGKLLLPIVESLKNNTGVEYTFHLVDANLAMMEGLREKVLEILPLATVILKQANFLDFVNECEEEFDICLSSFALHYSVGEERTAVLKWIRQSCRLFLLFEFDVDSELLSGSISNVQRFDTLVKKFEAGVEEYAGLDCQQLVKRWFLAPVFCLNFLSTSKSKEQSGKDWTRDFTDCGYQKEHVQIQKVAPYWWADCVLIVGSKKVVR
jgi:SAM-dependent methyltransferase